MLSHITSKILKAAFAVHSELGPGMLESAYEACLEFELLKAGLTLARQKPIPVRYRGITLDCGYRIDLLVEDSIVIEIKAVESIIPVHRAQVLSYLKFSACPIGLLINFHTLHLKDGIKRFILTPHAHATATAAES